MARFLQQLLQRLSGPRPKAVAAFWMAACIAVLTGCEEIEEDKPWIHVDRPQMLFTDTTLLDCYDKDVLSWKLKTAYLERWSDKEVVFMRPVLVDIYDSVGERVAFLRADSGRMDMKFTYVYAYGHVYALTPKGASVRADSLLWNKRDDQVKTDSYVRVVSEDGDVLQGKGFVSDARMDNWRILSNVTGIFQDAAKRMKEEDKKQAEELEKKPPAPPPAAAGPAPNSAKAAAGASANASAAKAGAASAADPKARPAKADDTGAAPAGNRSQAQQRPARPEPQAAGKDNSEARKSDNATDPSASAGPTRRPSGLGSRERARRRE